VGQRIVLAGEHATVVGVQPPGGRAPGGDTDVWLPLVMDPRDDDYWTAYTYTLHGVLAEGSRLDTGTPLGFLTASTGVYDSTLYPHNQRFHQAPISENTILVADPENPYIDAAAADGDTTEWVYHLEGMQCGAPGTGGGGGIYEADDAFDYSHEFGFVTKFVNTENYDTFLFSDLTTAYPNTVKADLWPLGQTVESVTRQVLFQVGRYFVVCDRVTSVHADAKKRVVMHCPDERGYTLLDGSWDGGPTPHGVEYGGTPGQWTTDGARYRWDRGGSRAFATVLYPAPESQGGGGRKLVRIGGTSSAGQWNQSGDSADPSFEFHLRELDYNYRWSDRYVSDGEYSILYDNGLMGFWRMEIEATGRKDHAFLHVYEITGTGQSEPTPVEYLEDVDEGRIGCTILHPGDNRVNVFSWDETLETEVRYRTQVDERLIHNVSDLAQGRYEVTELGSGQRLEVTVTESNLATFETPDGGDFVVRRVDAPDEPLASSDVVPATGAR